MKKICTILTLIILLCSYLPAYAASEPYPDIASDAVVVMDFQTGQVLYQKNMDKRLYPASTTKIMTALLTVELADPLDITTVSESALAIDEPNSANVGLKKGERITIEDLLYGMMLRSANEASNTLAEHVAGSQEAFALLMTEKAQEIGAVNTKFANAHGLHDPEHYTTAYDLALITRYAHTNEEFAKYYGTINYQMAATNEHPERTIETHLAMLFDVSPYYNETIIGGKIGFTDEAQHTMSTVATKDGRTLICVVLKAPTSREKYIDTTLLLDYCFDNFSSYTISGDVFSSFAVPISKDDEVILGNAYLDYEEDVTLYLPNGIDASMIQVDYDIPSRFESEADVGGYLSFSLPDAGITGIPPVLLRVPMDETVLMDAVPASSTVAEKGGFSLTALLKKAAPFAIGILLGLFILFLFMLVLRHHNLKKQRRRRIERRNRQLAERSSFGSTNTRRTGPSRPYNNASGRAYRK